MALLPLKHSGQYAMNDILLKCNTQKRQAYIKRKYSTNNSHSKNGDGSFPR